MYINAGELDKRIEIIKRVEETDNEGYPVTREVTVHRCWAKFTQTSGTEIVKANADFGEVKVRFLIRYTSKAIDRKMFVRYRGGRPAAGGDYEIQYINTYGDGRQYMEIWCRWRGNGKNAGGL
jgi:SPP1 family predicted phage head-tail adaptor